jgi:hypothetical protein
MNTIKISSWIGGLALAFAGSLLLYYEIYRNNEFIDGAAYGMLLIGWVLVFVEVTKNTSINAKKIFFKDDKSGWFKQRLTNMCFYLVLAALVFGNWYCISDLAYQRKKKILAGQPTKTTVATIGYINIHHGRRTTSYYAMFQYTADGEFINYPWHETNEDDFLVGDKYMIKYSVEYPKMFMITGKLR